MPGHTNREPLHPHLWDPVTLTTGPKAKPISSWFKPVDASAIETAAYKQHYTTKKADEEHKGQLGPQIATTCFAVVRKISVNMDQVLQY